MKTEEYLHCTRFSFTSILQTVPFLRLSFGGNVVHGEQTPFFGCNRVIRQPKGIFFFIELVPYDFLLVYLHVISIFSFPLWCMLGGRVEFE